MDHKADVKSMMALFQAGGASTDETSSTPGGRPKQPLHPTLSSSSAVQKKPVKESLSNSPVNIAPKPNFLKSTVSSKSDADTQEPNKIKAIASRLANAQDDTNNKPFTGYKPPKPELKPPAQKPPFNKHLLSATLSESKPVCPKPSLAPGPKPSWVKEDSGGGAAANTSVTPPKVPSPQHKPTSTVGKLKLQHEEESGSGIDTGSKPSPLANPAFKPSSNFRTAQNLFNKDKSEQTDSGGSNKPPQAAAKLIPPPAPLPSKKPSLKKPSPVSPHTGGINGNAAPGPKRNPLPNSLALGAAPAKPNRPPNVSLESFERKTESSSEGPGFKKPILLTPKTSHPSNHIASPAVPSLPPRHPEIMNQQECFYDDVEELTSSPAPPPLPSSAGHPSQRAKEEIDDDDGEMYVDLEERWEAADQEQEKKREKAEKEEKKRLEAEKREQNEREKKEQDIRKKFKLVGPLEVIHQVKARSKSKGSRTDLALKPGDSLDIIRVQGNPEGKWLGRTTDGSIGYVKITSVEIDFNSLKNRQPQQSYDPELYDDIDVLSSGNSGTNGPGVVLPPLPDDGEIYDDCVDPNLEVRVPPPSQFTGEGTSDHLGGAIDEEIYDDVDAENAPPPLPPISSLPGMKGKGRTEEMDPKKQEKFEIKEKEFRKKFKYDGEIQVLYQVTIVHTLTNKKWSNKELSIKAGEKLDVIVKAVDNKLICRNEDGKFGYVSTAHIVSDDGEIYDDIADDCIYDND